MKIIGIICEYNPLHNGHRKQLQYIRHSFGEDCGIVCLMSGNFVQRGQPAIFDKSLRAHAALLCGADLVLELPVSCCLSSAEGFAAGGVRILSGFCDQLCFGAETGTKQTLMDTAALLLSPAFSEMLKNQLKQGISFPAARVAALSELGADPSLLKDPNNILAVEYCKAILSQNSPLIPFPIRREGCYHDLLPDTENPSATAVRALVLQGQPWDPCVPEILRTLYAGADVYCPDSGERAILARLRTMSDAEFEALPFGSEGLWRRLMRSCREFSSLEDILSAVKTKRYTRTRLDRMVMCAFLGITRELLAAPAPYTRVLGLNSKGMAILRQARQSGSFPHTGETVAGLYAELESRSDDLYGLFRLDSPAKPGQSTKRRMIILP